MKPILLLSFAISIASNAAIISIPAANVTASSEIPPSFNRQDDFIVNGNGLSGGLHNITPDGGMWLSRGTGFGGDDLDPSVSFDLGAVYTINSFRVWNYNEAGNLSRRGVNGVSVEYGETLALGATVAGITNFTQAPGANGYAGELYNSFAPFDARYVKFDIDSNHGGDNNFYGLSEVQFDGVLAPTTVIPEPSSTALLGLGILSIAFLRRK